jgi:hypothetical protein
MIEERAGPPASTGTAVPGATTSTSNDSQGGTHVTGEDAVDDAAVDRAFQRHTRGERPHTLQVHWHCCHRSGYVHPGRLQRLGGHELRGLFGSPTVGWQLAALRARCYSHPSCSTWSWLCTRADLRTSVRPCRASAYCGPICAIWSCGDGRRRLTELPIGSR